MGTFDPIADELPSMDAEAQIRSELRPGERLVWVGQPDPRRWMLGALPVVVIGVPWTAFAVFWMAGASGLLDAVLGKGAMPNGSTLGRIGFACIGIPFVLIGLAITSGPYWARRKAQRTAYAVTDRRVLILDGGLSGGTMLRSFSPEDLQRITRYTRPDGSGNLIFEERITRDSEGNRSTSQRGFMAIPRVREVEDLIRKTLLGG